MKFIQKLCMINAIIVLGVVGVLSIPRAAQAQYRSYDWRMRLDNGGSVDSVDFQRTFSRMRTSSSLQRKINALDNDPVENLPIPILLGLGVGQFPDSWGDARANGRTHEGTDLLTARGAFIVSPTDAVVTSIGDGGNGGIHVYTANPGDETFYYAHLDSVNPDLDEGDVLEPGDLIGYVGNTGNAAGGPTHLHFGIYDNDHDATNPFPRLTQEFSIKEKMEALEKILDNADDEDVLAAWTAAQYRSTFTLAKIQGIPIPDAIEQALLKLPPPAPTGERVLLVGIRGEDVLRLQMALIKENSGVGAGWLAASASSLGYFDFVTKNAVAEYQQKNYLIPDGIAGPKTKASLRAKGYIL